MPLTARSRLHGKTVFLSASVPTAERAHEYPRIEDAATRIEEAVMSVSRAVFMESGTLVFGAHPSISPLVARIIDDYYLPTTRDGRDGAQGEWKNPSLIIYQSKVWEKDWAAATIALTRHPLVSVRWTGIVRGESVDIAIRDRPQAPQSMLRMRQQMIEETAPEAMVAIGGMKGVLEEAEVFTQYAAGRPIYALATTGGVAALLADIRPSATTNIRSIDQEVLRQISRRSAESRDGSTRKMLVESRSDAPATPYIVVAEAIVDELIASLRTPPAQGDFHR